MDHISAQILQFLQTEVVRSGNAFGRDTELFVEGLLDSMNLIQLMSFVEDSFDIRVDPLDLSYENFGSVNRLSNFVQNKIARPDA